MENSLATKLARLSTGDDSAVVVETPSRLCGLWAGMGSIFEVNFQSASHPRSSNDVTVRQTIIVKQIVCPEDLESIGDVRKRDSYQCEANFYANGFAAELKAIGCEVPKPLHISRSNNNVTICMSKLVGDPGSMDFRQSKAVLTWLAKLHSNFYGHEKADEAVKRGLQPQGTYWYLDTRSDEHDAMPTIGWEGRLRLAARALDMRLKREKHVSIVHGDLKDANIIFAKTRNEDGTMDNKINYVPLIYDFQYCGKACIAKDLAYFLTCGSGVEVSKERSLLIHYHNELTQQLERQRSTGKGNLTPPSLEELEILLQLCYCDLGRWMSGWGWWGKSREAQIISVLDSLDNGDALENEMEYARAMERVYPLH